ncbi:unnamed protein product [Scytosiphon promiscuus]
MEQAINTGDPDEVWALLSRLDKVPAIKELTGCYGGRSSPNTMLRVFVEDGHGLRRMTNPLLHAARTGITSMFSAVHGAMQEKLRARQVKMAMQAKDQGSRSLLIMAAASKNRDMLEAALAALEQHLTKDEVKDIVISMGPRSHCEEDENNMLDWAFRSGCEDLFEAALAAVNKWLTQKEVRALMTHSARGPRLRNRILESAAASGDDGTWQAILTALETTEVKDEVMSMEPDAKKSVLKSAIRSGSVDTFVTVLADLDDHLLLEEEYVEALHAAAKSGNTDMLVAVLGMLEMPDEDKMKAMTMPCTGRESTSALHAAAGSGSKEMFEAVLAALAANPDEVKRAIKATGPADAGGFSAGGAGPDSCTILHSAAFSGSRDVVEAVKATIGKWLNQEEIKALLEFKRSSCDVEFLPRALIKSGRSILHSAVMSSSDDLFEAVLIGPVGNMSSVEVKNILISAANNDGGLLEDAVKCGDADLFRTVVRETKEEFLCDGSQAYDLLYIAASTGCVDMWKAVTEVAMQPSATGRLEEKVLQDNSLVQSATFSRDPATLRAVLAFIEEGLHVELPQEALGKCAADRFLTWTSAARGNLARMQVVPSGLGWAIEILSCFLAYPGEIDPKYLVQLARVSSEERIGTCFLETVASVENPFVPGVTLSVALAKAAAVAPQGERRELLSLQQQLDGLLLEILERLPSTVQAFKGTMAGCSAVFEPEVPTGLSRGSLGPLRMVLQERGHMETFCTQPLIVDFLTRRFTRGLPDLLDTKSVLSDSRQVDALANRGARSPEYESLSMSQRQREDELRLERSLIIDVKDRIWDVWIMGEGEVLDTLLSPCRMLQGIEFGSSDPRTSLSLLPGAQFLTAGLVAMPDAYYMVPAMRMGLDFAVYLGMLALFSLVTLSHDDGPLTTGEILFAVYLLGGVTTELGELRRGVDLYIADHWNPIDMLGLGLAAGGFIARFADRTSSSGRVLYALSAPLIFSRLLFFAQLFRFQGPMIQVIFSMLGEMIKFGVVILVVMLGFAVSFHSLFEQTDTFGQTCLTLFKGMLGEVGFFDDFRSDEYSEYEGVATALFMVFLVIMAIMLLNLLIAVLSTSHAKVQEKAEQEFRVSRARLINLYRLSVDKHLLPPPFNLVQLVVSLPLFLVDRSWRGPRCTRAKEAVGRAAFWLVMGTSALVGGTALWMASALYAPFRWRRHCGSDDLGSFSMLLRHLIVFMWCIVGAPLYLAAFWITAPLKWIGLRPSQWLWDRRELDTSLSKGIKSVDSMLTDRPGGLSVGELQDCLEDPMGDPQVRQDEKDRPATVEHIKQLRDRIEKTNEVNLGTKLKQVEQEVTQVTAKIEQEVGNAEARLGARMMKAEEELHRKLDGILAVVQAEMVRKKN